MNPKYLFTGSVLACGNERWWIGEAQQLLGATVEWKDKDELGSFGIRFAKSILSVPTGRLAQTDPIGSAIASSVESFGIDQGLQ